MCLYTTNLQKLIHLKEDIIAAWITSRDNVNLTEWNSIYVHQSYKEVVGVDGWFTDTLSVNILLIGSVFVYLWLAT